MQLEQSVQEASYPLRHDIDLHLTVMAVRRLPFIANLSEVDRAMLSTVVSELGSNILKYAQRGDHPHPPPSQRAPLHRHRRPRSGPRHWGRASGHAGSLQHFGHPGPGLPGVRRMMSELTISTPPEGNSGAGPQVAGRGAPGIQTNRPSPVPASCTPACSWHGPARTAPAIRNGSQAIWPSSYGTGGVSLILIDVSGHGLGQQTGTGAGGGAAADPRAGAGPPVATVAPALHRYPGRRRRRGPGQRRAG